jgi:hypothetical protein
MSVSKAHNSDKDFEWIMDFLNIENFTLSTEAHASHVLSSTENSQAWSPTDIYILCKMPLTDWSFAK